MMITYFNKKILKEIVFRLKKYVKMAHRCTGIENPGEGVAQTFAKILGGRGQGFFR
jgi:hypothetical protein